MLHTHHDLQRFKSDGSFKNFQNCPLGYENHGENILRCIFVHDDVDPIVNGICFLVLLFCWAISQKLRFDRKWSQTVNFNNDGLAGFHVSDAE